MSVIKAALLLRIVQGLSLDLLYLRHCFTHNNSNYH